MVRSPFKVRADGVAGGMIADTDEVRRAIKLFADPEHGFELMSLTRGINKTLPADKVDEICEAIGSLPSGLGIYFRVNPVPKTRQDAALNGDIVSRRWIYIDVDPVKAAEGKDASATDSEKGATSEVCDSMVEYLSNKGWPAPVVVDSGNGFGVFYRCDLPNDDLSQEMLKRLLKNLADKFTGPKGTIDKSVHNANRLAKLPGTWARKGAQSDDRPHRPCRILFVPELIDCVSFDMLQEAAKKKESPKKTASVVSTPTSTGGRESYGRKAMDAECARVVLAQNSGEGRNNALNRAAFSLSQLVAGGVLNESEVRNRLYEAAVASGLDKDPGCGERGILSTIDSGFRAGKEKPRTVPESSDPRAVIGKAPPQLEPGEKLTIKLSKVQPARVEWLIKDRIPKRFITIFAGRTGVGKSFISHDLIARLSTGGEIPFGGGECFKASGTLILSEDSPEFVLAPRLAEAGADMDRIHCMTWKAMANYHLGNTDMLTDAIKENEEGVSLVMIDPPTNFLAETDEHKNSEVRQLVMKVVEWAFERDLAVLFILHVNKQSGKGVEALNRVMGSVAWVTTSRIAHTLCIDPDDPKQCLWVPLKNNLGKLAKAISYRINGTNELEGRAKVEWIAEVDTTADEALGHAPKQRRDVAASEWLIERFREKLEWASDDLVRAAHETNISRNALFEGKKLLSIPAKKRTAENGDQTWFWWVPADWVAFNNPAGQPAGTVGTLETLEP